MENPNAIETVVVGASAAGLAVGACLKQTGSRFVILEQEDQVGAAWRRHYDRLHLHTSKGLSGLPLLPMPKSYSRYPSRQQVVEYFESYAGEMGLEPRFGQRVTSIGCRNGSWLTQTTKESWSSANVIIATGYTRKPVTPEWSGRERFKGTILHSSEYRNPWGFLDQRVMVVGFGNSGGEIALDLAENGVDTTLSIRGEVNAIPRDLLGIPILAWGLALRLLPMKVADWVSKPLIWASVGDIRKLGLRRLPFGPNTQIRREGRIPLLDVGTLEAIRAGRIEVRPGIEAFDETGVTFTDGQHEELDVVVAATGYQPALTDYLVDAQALVDEHGVPFVSGGATAAEGLFFCGLRPAATGMLREIGIEARRIVSLIVQDR